MQEQANRALVRRIYEGILNRGELELADQVIANGAIDHAPPDLSSLPTAGPDELKAFVHAFCTGFPDAQWDIDEMLAVDDKVLVRTTVNGTHLGEFLGLEATGDELTMTGIDIVRIDGGQIVEHWGTLPPLQLRASTSLSSKTDQNQVYIR